VSDTGDSASFPQSLVKLTRIEKPTTGEETETTLAEARVCLYEFEKSNGWKERGVGIIKINTDQSKYRLLMRTETTLKLILNASIYPEMQVQEQNKNQIRFTCINTVVSEDTSTYLKKISNFIIKFQTKQVFEDFFKVFQSAKIAVVPLKKVSPAKETPHTTTDESKSNEEKSEVKDKPEETKLDEEKAKAEN
jgi:hypothetical protein